MRRRLIALTVASLLLTGGVLSSSAPAGAETEVSAPSFAAGFVRLDGAQEVPGPGDPDGRGTFTYVAFGNRLCYLLTAARIATPTAAHIHTGARGVAGGIVVGLVTPTRGFSADCITAQPGTDTTNPTVLSQGELDAIIANPAGFYVNVHNAEFPDGAIRGQLR
jgi:hypothetical protein